MSVERIASIGGSTVIRRISLCAGHGRWLISATAASLYEDPSIAKLIFISLRHSSHTRKPITPGLTDVTEITSSKQLN